MQFIDLAAQYRALKTEIDANIQTVLDSAQFISGPQVKELEGKLAAFVGRRHCISCANGTDALQLAFMVAGAVVSRDIPDYALAYGCPAEVRGWVCRCGEKLAFDGARAVCEACGITYEKHGDTVMPDER